LPPRKIYSGYTPQDPGALPAFTLFAAHMSQVVWVGMCQSEGQA